MTLPPPQGLGVEDVAKAAALNSRSHGHAPREPLSSRLAVWMYKLKHTQRCPGCGIRVIRNGGCHRMQCSCGTAFCWVCGAHTSSQRYSLSAPTLHPRSVAAWVWNMSARLLAAGQHKESGCLTWNYCGLVRLVRLLQSPSCTAKAAVVLSVLYHLAAAGSRGCEGLRELIQATPAVFFLAYLSLSAAYLLQLVRLSIRGRRLWDSGATLKHGADKGWDIRLHVALAQCYYLFTSAITVSCALHAMAAFFVRTSGLGRRTLVGGDGGLAGKLHDFAQSDAGIWVTGITTVNVMALFVTLHVHTREQTKRTSTDKLLRQIALGKAVACPSSFAELQAQASQGRGTSLRHKFAVCAPVLASLACTVSIVATSSYGYLWLPLILNYKTFLSMLVDAHFLAQLR